MADDDTWTCPSCAQRYPVSVRTCRGCNVTQVRKRITNIPPPAEPKAPEERIEIDLPSVIPEARFSLPLPQGAIWTSGLLLAVQEGLFLLSEKDGYKPETISNNLPKDPASLGPNSLFLRTSVLLRVVHDRFKGQFVEAEEKKIPIRLDPDGWRRLKAVCGKLGIPYE